MIVYKITNNINNKIYIGQTRQCINQRWREHCRKSNSGNKLGNAIKKYGRDNFKLETIEICENLEQLNIRETYWITFYDSCNVGYNIREGGFAYIMGDETKEKIRQVNLGKKHTDETKKKMSEAAKAKPKRSEETCEKLRIANTGAIFTEERKQNISKAIKGRVLTEEWKLKIKISLNKTFAERKKRKEDASKTVSN